MSVSRRALLLAAALAATALPGARADDDPCDALRRRWLGIALGSRYDPGAEPYASRLAELGAAARGFRDGMAPAPGSLWPGHPFDPPAGITSSYGRLWTTAQAYAQPGTGSTGDDALLAAVLRGLDHLSATVHHPATTPYGNWWEWRIGSPRPLMDITAALYDRLGPARVAAARAAVGHFVPDALLTGCSGTFTGANRVDLCRSAAPSGVLGRDPRRIALAQGRPLTRLPVRHPGRRPPRRRLLRAAHVGRLLGDVRPGPPRRPGAAVRPPRRLPVGGHRPRPAARPGQRRARLRAAPARRAGDGLRQRPCHQPGLPALRRPARAARRPRPRARPDRRRRPPRRRRERGGAAAVARHDQGLGRTRHDGTGPDGPPVRRRRPRAAPQGRRGARPPRPPNPSATGSSRPWTGPSTAAPASPPPSRWPATGSRTTSAATARTRAAGTPAPACSPGGRRAAAASTPTGTGRPWTGTGSRARPCRPAACPTGPAASGAPPPGRTSAGPAGPPTGGTRPSAGT